jgi:ABC-type lipoprotein export system ATPase subunit
VLELREISKAYPIGGEMVEVLHGVSMDVRPGRMVAIVGPSGSGKSTLLNLIGTLDAPSGGRLLFDGREIGGLDPAAAASFRAANLGFVFQFFNLLPGLTARQNVELAAAIGGGGGRRSRRRAGELLEQVGLAAQVDAPARNLSGGQMQRVAIARALVNEPRLILADEPTGNLDRRNAGQVLALLREQAAGERAVAIVTHDHDLAARFADEIVSLVDGRIDGRAEPSRDGGTRMRRLAALLRR